MSARDDFSQSTKNSVAARAGWHCSFAECGKLTVGPSEEAPNAVTMIGKAAHIAAAASGRGARRYDALMTPEQRAGIDNAIWLCADHADLIDRDEVTFTTEKLHTMKRAHEASIARSIRMGSKVDLVTGLLAIGRDIICTGDLIDVSAGIWTLQLRHFLSGDMHKVVAFIDGFANVPPENQYILSNELGDGRVLTASPKLIRGADGYSLTCPVAPSFPRINAQKLGSTMALDPETNDSYLDENGHIARTSGVDCLPQNILNLFSMNEGENVYFPTSGMRFFEYYEAFRGSPWLDLLLKLDAVRQASVPHRNGITGQLYTPLQCVTRVRSIDLLADKPTDDRLPIRVTFDVQGVGEWVRELRIFMPTAEQMANRLKFLSEVSRQ